MFNNFNSEISFLVNGKISNKEIEETFNENTIEFLSCFSNNLIKDINCRKYSDLISLSFWCSKRNLSQLRKKYEKKELRLGRGLVFHITPSNVPTNFIYSLIFGLISGNSNIVKVPSNEFKQIDLICFHLNKLLKMSKFKLIKNKVMIIRYDSKKKDITDYISNICDLRVIWGGDETINSVRESKIRPHATDITFADRYSFTIINSKKILKLNNILTLKLVKNFFNDSFLMDQNACTSPHIIMWLGNKADKIKASNIFWKNLESYASKNYDIPDIAIIDKFNQLCIDAAKDKNFKKVNFKNKILSVIELKNIDEYLHYKRGKWGYFYEFNLKELNKLNKIINHKYQTVTYYGLEKKIFENYLIKNKIKGVDRFVPIGNSLKMGLTWDGIDIINSFSRAIEIV
tara:strand:+ start:1319 stop:2524 length:1206 start_codon:yes stop_codon:yes gene_type:complete